MPKKVSSVEPAALTEHDAATYAGVSVGLLRKLRGNQTGPAVVRLGRAVRYRRAALDHWLDSLTVEPAGAGRDARATP